MLRSLSRVEYLRRWYAAVHFDRSDGVLPCAHCKALEDEPTIKEPHVNLRGGAVYTGHEAILERYRCRECGTVWDRLKSKAGSTGKEYRWQMLVRGRDHHKQ